MEVNEQWKGVVLLDPICGTRQVLDLITNKWVLLIICALAQGTSRYNQLLRNLPNVTHKMLTQTLRSMERDGLVERKIYLVVPSRVEYSLTPLGHSLHASFDVLLTWARDNLGEVEVARHQYDDQQLDVQ